MGIKNFDVMRIQDKLALESAKNLAQYLDDRDDYDGGRDHPCLRDCLADFIDMHTPVQTGRDQ